jgi:hypothetical protein
MKEAEVKPIVYEELAMNKEDRNDDMLLIRDVCERYCANPKVPFWKLLTDHVKYGLPSFASIIRYRRAIQIEHPELNSDEHIAMLRKEEEKKYKDRFGKGDPENDPDYPF